MISEKRNKIGLGILMKVSLPSEQQSEQNRTFVRLLKEGQVRLCLKNYKDVLELHLQAKKNCGQMGDLVDELLILDYLRLEEIGKALRLLALYETRKLSSEPNIFFLQVYSKLGQREQFLKVFNALEDNGQFQKFPGRMVIANICLMLLCQQWGDFKQMKELFEKIYNQVYQLEKVYTKDMLKIFRIDYFLLRYSFKLNKFRERQQILQSIHLCLVVIQEKNPKNYQNCCELLKDREDWDFRLGYFGW